MINKIITSEGNVQFIYGDSGKIINVHPFHVYTVFNVDTVSFLLIAMPKDSGLAIFTTKAEDLEVNGETYTFEELPNALSEAFAIAGAQARAEIVDELPETGMTNTIYLVPKEDGHGYDEYIYIKETGTWELIGDTDIELSRYVKKTDFNAYTAQTAAKIDYLSGATDAEVARATSAETALDEKIDGKVIELTQAEYDALEEVDPKVIYVITDAVPVNMADYVKKVDFNSYSAATKTAMDNETSDRTSADTAEQTAREAADSFISGAVDTLSTALANEVQRAQNAESGLSEDIEDEMTRAMVIEDALQDAIDAVSGNVETETARAEGAESDLDDKIDAVSAATDDALALKQDTLVAGENITINGNVISAEGGVAVDAALYSDSTNPVMNQALYNELRIVEENDTRTKIVLTESSTYNEYHAFYVPSDCHNLEFVFKENYTSLNITVNENYQVDIYYDDVIKVNFIDQAFNYSINGNILKLNLTEAITGITSNGEFYGIDANYLFYGESSVTPLIDKVKENEEVTSAALNELNENKANASDLGGLKLVKITQSAYDALSTKDANTLYIIID